MEDKYHNYDRLALVSSLYSPGTVLCWLLTMLGCAISWGIHPEKRRSDSIDSDFMATMTYSAVAANHLIFQASNLRSSFTDTNVSSQSEIQQRIASLEAALNITETSMTLLGLLFLISSWNYCVKRSVVLVVIGILGYCAQAYLYWSVGDSIQSQFSRMFMLNFHWAFLSQISIVGGYIVASACLLTLYFIRKRGMDLPVIDARETGDMSSTTKIKLRATKPKEMQILTALSFLSLPFTFLCGNSGLVTSIFQDLPPGMLSTLKTVFSRLSAAVIPKSNVSIYDLDQAVALVGGLTVLGFKLYGAMNARFKQSMKKP